MKVQALFYCGRQKRNMTFNSDFRPLEMVRIKIVLILCEPIKR